MPARHYCPSDEIEVCYLGLIQTAKMTSENTFLGSKQKEQR